MPGSARHQCHDKRADCRRRGSVEEVIGDDVGGVDDADFAGGAEGYDTDSLDPLRIVPLLERSGGRASKRMLAAILHISPRAVDDPVRKLESEGVVSASPMPQADDTARPRLAPADSTGGISALYMAQALRHHEDYEHSTRTLTFQAESTATHTTNRSGRPLLVSFLHRCQRAMVEGIPARWVR